MATRVAGALLLVLAPVADATAAGVQLPLIVVDKGSGAVLIEQKAFDRWYPASLTKLMTVYVVLRAKAAGEVSAGTPVVVSKNASGQPPSSLGFPPGSVLRLDTTLEAMVVKSANDLAIALAESVAGSVPAFVERMNAEARRLGMAQSRFANPNGLHSVNQFTSARDMALLARSILTEFPQSAAMFAIPAIRTGSTVHHSYNLLLERFRGADGMKTGFVCASGYNIVASATRNGRQLIAVVAGTFSQTERATEAARLLIEGFKLERGPALEEFSPAAPPAAARDLRPSMCSEKARKERYDPAPGDAVIVSEYLEARQETRQPVEISLGGADEEPAPAVVASRASPAGRIPVPERRPLQ